MRKAVLNIAISGVASKGDTIVFEETPIGLAIKVIKTGEYLILVGEKPQNKIFKLWSVK